MKLILVLISLSIAASCTGTGSIQQGNGAGTSNHGQPTSDHSRMNHGTVESSPGAKDAPLDLQFIDTMIVHHQGAIEMSKLGSTRAEAPEMKKFTAAVIADQDREIAEMKRWRKQWFGDAAPAINLEMPGMKMSVEHSGNSNLAGLAGKEFDLEYIRQMIPHHEGAVEMSKAFLANPRAGTAKPELKKLAESIVKAQESEITLLREWQTKWAK